MQQKYKEYIRLNKSLIISIIAAVSLSALTAQLLADQESYVNSSYTLLVDMITFYATFSTLFYLDNRKKYRLESGQLDKTRLKRDLIKIISSLGIGEVIYIISRWTLQYYFLSINYDPYLASITAHIISVLLYLIVVNLSAKIMRLYKDGT